MKNKKIKLQKKNFKIKHKKRAKTHSKSKSSQTTNQNTAQRPPTKMSQSCLPVNAKMSKAKKVLDEARETQNRELDLVDKGISSFEELPGLCKCKTKEVNNNCTQTTNNKMFAMNVIKYHVLAFKLWETID